MPESLHLGHGTMARPLIEPALDPEVSLVTVAGRPYPPTLQHLIRAIRAYPWERERAASNGVVNRHPRAVQPEPSLETEGPSLS